MVLITYLTYASERKYNMSGNNKNTHLTLEERRIILKGIENESTKKAIALTIGKDNSTVGKEIRLHRELVKRSSLPRECSNYRKCVFDRKCTADCPEYSAFYCSRRDRSPGACNGCSSWSHCRFSKYTYNPEKAQKAYEETLTDSRTGVDLTVSEARKIADIAGPLLKQGQSPYQIVASHPELGICERTLYNYIEDGVLQEIAGIGPMDLRRQVGRRMTRKDKAKYKKRQDRKYLEGRTYSLYRKNMDENPDVCVVQMDTVYNDITDGPFVQTFKFLGTGLMLGFWHDEKTQDAMVQGVDSLESLLGTDLFRKLVHVLLTDRGGEFQCPERFEKSGDGTMRTRVYYCDPMQSGQKGTLENSHILLRYICPKGTDLRALGLDSQEALNLALSHINSAPVESLGGKSPLEMTEFIYPELYQALSAFGIRKVKSDNVILKPYLLKKNHR